jgi:hypothetical protein
LIDWSIDWIAFLAFLLTIITWLFNPKMTKIRDLPVELFFIIRSFLIEGLQITQEDEGTTTTSKAAELSWSWTNFLSTSNHEEWKFLRKRTMIWSLNYCEAKASLRCFEGCLDNQPPISDGPKVVHEKNKFNTTVINHECIKDFLASYAHITALRLPNYSRSLNFFISLSGFCSLIYLTLSEYRVFSKVELPNLSFLRIEKGISRASLECFPLEQIKELSFRCNNNSLISEFNETVSPLPRLQSIIILEITKLTSKSFHLPDLPTLQSLTLSGFPRVTISGFPNLKKLKLTDTRDLMGPIERLACLFSFTAVFSHERLKLSYTFKSLETVWLAGIFTTKEIYDVYFYLRTKFFDDRGDHHQALWFALKSHLSEYSIVIDRQSMVHQFVNRVIYPELHKDLEDFSVLPHLQSLTLTYCFTVTETARFRDIPSLTLIHCDNIRDYSGLGSQRFLEIQGAPLLYDEDVETFGNIFSLKLSYCHRLRSSLNLRKNRYLTVSHCANLNRIQLSGGHYIQVTIRNCPSFQLLSVYGKVHCGIVSDCPEFKEILEEERKNFTYCSKPLK